MPAEANPSVDFHDGHTEIKLSPQALILVDIDTLHQETVPLEGLPGRLAEVAVSSGVKNRFLCHTGPPQKGEQVLSVSEFWGIPAATSIRR